MSRYNRMNPDEPIRHDWTRDEPTGNEAMEDQEGIANDLALAMMTDHPDEPTPALSRETWIARCAARFKKRAGVDDPTAKDMAEAQLENVNDDLTSYPEEAADDEMSYWSED